MFYVYLTFFLCGGFMFIALWRYILMAIYYGGMALAVVLAWRIIALVNGDSFTLEYAKPIFVGGISALVVCILCSGYIRHTVIMFYLRSAIQRDKDNAAKGKLW